MTTDLNDLMLEAAAEVENVMIEFEMEMQKPQMLKQFAKLWAELPDEGKEQFKRERPEEYRALIAGLKGES
ncbi:MAG: hypothetical protein KC496_23020 [Anaerolineae bacterium]|nr:hypothetical protein [Anaerolineae bacterium]